MIVSVDTGKQTVNADGKEMPLYSREGFELLSRLWLKVGWNQKHTYTFSWLGMPIIQLPEDMIRYQELVVALRPDVIIETGVAHGGSLVFSASLCALLKKGRVIGIDIATRPVNRERIQSHPMAQHISLVDGDSTSPEVVAEVGKHIRPGDVVLAVLDSNHSYAHVLAELYAYAPLVTKGSYIVATDGIMKDLTDVPRGQKEWNTDNPENAAADFARNNPDFILEEPPWPFNESELEVRVTHWPGAYLKRIR
ncbi:MAG TPA: CmcI family methyltransferase [Rhizomicrobium sp.]